MKSFGAGTSIRVIDPGIMGSARTADAHVDLTEIHKRKPRLEAMPKTMSSLWLPTSFVSFIDLILTLKLFRSEWLLFLFI